MRAWVAVGVVIGIARAAASCTPSEEVGLSPAADASSGDGRANGDGDASEPNVPSLVQRDAALDRDSTADAPGDGDAPTVDAPWPGTPRWAPSCDGIFAIRHASVSPRLGTDVTYWLDGCCRDDGTCGGWAPSFDGGSAVEISAGLGCVTASELEGNVINHFSSSSQVLLIGPEDGGPCNPASHLADSGIDVSMLRNCGPLQCEEPDCPTWPAEVEPSCSFTFVGDAMSVTETYIETACGLIGWGGSSEGSVGGVTTSRSERVDWFDPRTGALVGTERSRLVDPVGPGYPCEGLVPGSGCTPTATCRLDCISRNESDGCATIRSMLAVDDGGVSVADGGPRDASGSPVADGGSVTDASIADGG